MTELRLDLTILEDEAAIDAMHDTQTSNWAWNAELRAAVADKIRRFPNTEAAWWIGPEAVLSVVEQFLIRGGVVPDVAVESRSTVHPLARPTDGNSH